MALRSVFLYLVLLTVVVAVRAQGCSLESLMELSSLREIVESTSAVGGIGDSPEPPDNLTIYDQNVVCLAAAETRNEYRYASVVMVFSCVGTTPAGSMLGAECVEGNYTSQFDFECLGDLGDLSWQESREPFVVGTGSTFFNMSDANVSTEWDTFCSLCVDPDIQGFPIGFAIDQITHCAGCHGSCLESPDGQELCTGVATGDCCNFFENDMCVDQCSDGSAPQEDGSSLVCVPVCDVLPSPTSGSVDYSTSGPLFLGTVAMYSCDTGYTLGDPVSATCVEGTESELMWSPSETPECTSRKPVDNSCDDDSTTVVAVSVSVSFVVAFLLGATTGGVVVWCSVHKHCRLRSKAASEDTHTYDVVSPALPNRIELNGNVAYGHVRRS